MGVWVRSHYSSTFTSRCLLTRCRLLSICTVEQFLAFVRYVSYFSVVTPLFIPSPPSPHHRSPPPLSVPPTFRAAISYQQYMDLRARGHFFVLDSTGCYCATVRTFPSTRSTVNDGSLTDGRTPCSQYFVVMNCPHGQDSWVSYCGRSGPNVMCPHNRARRETVPVMVVGHCN